MFFRLANRLPVKCSQSRNAARWALETSGPEGGSRSSFRCASLRMNASPAAWLDSVGAMKSFDRTEYPQKCRIPEVPGQARFLEVHDVFSPSRSGADEDHPAKHRGAVLRHLLRDHPAERVERRRS
jgi:hypothetical protein